MRFGDSRPLKKFLVDRFGVSALLSPDAIAVDSCLLEVSIRDCCCFFIKSLGGRSVDFSALFSVSLFFAPDSCFKLGLRESRRVRERPAGDCFDGLTVISSFLFSSDPCLKVGFRERRRFRKLPGDCFGLSFVLLVFDSGLRSLVLLLVAIGDANKFPTLRLHLLLSTDISLHALFAHSSGLLDYNSVFCERMRDLRPTVFVDRFHGLR